MKKIDRTGEVKTNLKGLEMKIVEYKNNKEVRVVFTASGETRVTTYLKFKQGKVFPTWRNMKAKVATADVDELQSGKCGTAMAIVLTVGLIGAMIVLGCVFGCIVNAL